MAMLIKHLPIELILKTTCMFTDIRDIMSFFNSNKDIEQIIINNLKYIIKNFINTNKHIYPQMSMIVSCCYHLRKGYEYNLQVIHKICEFITKVPKNEIISNSDKLVVYNTNMQYIIYYNCRINCMFTHNEAWDASILLDFEKLKKMRIFLDLNYQPINAIHAAQLTDEEVIKMNMIIENNIDHFNSIRAVNELTDEGIVKMLELVKRDIPPTNAIDAVIDLDDEEIEIMCQVFNEGIDADVARYSSVYSEEHRNIMIYLFHKNIDIDIIIDVIENSVDERINWFVSMIDNNINADFASNIIEDEDIDDDKFNEFINLIKINIECKLARTIIDKFDSLHHKQFLH
jgi:hypothetical protein